MPLITFGYHTKTHSILSNLKNKSLDNEINPHILEKKLKRKIECFAYPFGEETSYNKNSIKSLKKYYKHAFSTTENFYSKKDYLIERLSIENVSIPEFTSIIEGSNIFITKIYKKLRFF